MTKGFWIIILLFVTFFIIFANVAIKEVFSQDNTYLDISVKVSVCGDGIVEGVEQCEPLNYRLVNCSNYGYAEGYVFCDNSCNYDFSNCRGELFLEENTSIFQKKILNKKTLDAIKYMFPVQMVIFDYNKNGYFEANEIKDLLNSWVEAWRIVKKGEINEKYYLNKTICDLNDDDLCDLVDFSILMYYL